MKRILLASGILLLAACGSEETQVEEQEQTIPEGQTEQTEEVQVSDDPLEVADSTNDITEFQDGLNVRETVGRYTSDMTNEEGFVELEKEGYNIKFALLLMETEGEQDIRMLGEHHNQNDDGGLTGLFDAIEMVTSEGEQVNPSFGVGSVEPGIREKFSDRFSIDYENPESVTLTIYEPIDKDSDDNEEVVWEEIEFHLE